MATKWRLTKWRLAKWQQISNEPTQARVAQAQAQARVACRTGFSQAANSTSDNKAELEILSDSLSRLFSNIPPHPYI